MEKLIENSKSKNAVIYARVTSRSQDGADSSLENQKTICELFAAKKGLNVLKTFEEVGGSKISDERKVLNEMMEYLEQNKNIGFVIVYSCDRLSRDQQDSFSIVREMNAKGVFTLSVYQGIRIDDLYWKFMSQY